MFTKSQQYSIANNRLLWFSNSTETLINVFRYSWTCLYYFLSHLDNFFFISYFNSFSCHPMLRKKYVVAIIVNLYISSSCCLKYNLSPSKKRVNKNIFPSNGEGKGNFFVSLLRSILLHVKRREGMWNSLVSLLRFLLISVLCFMLLTMSTMGRFHNN